jgi:thiamine biosynthesis lipoprotein ApbE
MKRILKCALISVAAASCVFASACGNDKYSSKKYMNYFFNTSADIVITEQFDDENVVESISQMTTQASEFFAKVQSSLNIESESSYLTKFNKATAGEKVEIDEITYTVMGIAKSVYELTEGYYNPAVYYSVDLYGFSARSSSMSTITANSMPYDREWVSNGDYSCPPLPDEKYVTAFKELSTHFGEITLEHDESEDKYYVTKPADAFVVVDDVRYEMAIDLGGVAKGYCADKVSDLFDSQNIKYAYFNFGSSSISVKENYYSDDNVWVLGLTDPRNSSSDFARVNVKDVNLSTSGDYVQYYEIDGVRYSHIIDPTTGSPIQTGIASVTIVGGDAAEDDALTTALSAMGKDKAMEFINAHLSDRMVVMLYIENGDGKIITNTPDNLIITNPNYTLL